MMYVSMVDTCFFGSSTVTNRSRVSVAANGSRPSSSSSSSCSLLKSEDVEAGLDISPGVPLVSQASCVDGEESRHTLTLLFVSINGAVVVVAAVAQHSHIT